MTATALSARAGEGLLALARFTSDLEFSRLPPAIVVKAKACLLYALTVGAAGLRAEQARQVVEAFAAAGKGKTVRFFDGRKVDPICAALANGTLFHARVQDDAHPAGHVGVVVVPAALAMAEAAGANGPKLIAALVAGYEVALRIGRDHAADLSARGFRTTPAYGVFGAAAAASLLLGLDAERVAHALALAANMAGGLREYSEAGSNDYALQAGTAAANGIVAARLAAAGASGAASALDGRAGFFRAYGETGRTYGTRLTEDLGSHFEMEAITYKPYPICQFHRGVVRGAAKLRESAQSTPLKALTVRMHPFEADFFGVRFAGPFSTFPQTFMSIPFCAALAWTSGTATFDGLNSFAARDVLAVVPRVEVVADAARARYQPQVIARLQDGRSLEWQDDGAAGYSLTWDTAVGMTHSLCGEAGIDEARAKALIAAVRGLDAASGIGAVTTAMKNACRNATS
jgi:2-methylcitrate dehydratase PrpD